MQTIDDPEALSLPLDRGRRLLMLFAHGLAVLLILSVLAVSGGLPLTVRVGLVLSAILGCSTLVLGAIFGSRTVRRLGAQVALLKTALNANQQIEELFAMTDMLQAAEERGDAGAVLQATAARLLPDFSGALYVFNNSRDRLDLAANWNCGEGFQPTETLQPQSCWALKRGKPHINHADGGTLLCSHPVGVAATVEVPMMTRGQVYGLLVLATGQDGAVARLLEVRRLARALADSMSLALSNISLREKLRTLSLRDPLTGLYNRRYMEDALERYVDLAERTGTPISVMMIDLDNFKLLNDSFGHVKGDAVLRDVAVQLVGGLRPADVVARYGGEELLVVLPNCSLEAALSRAEVLRGRIASLTEAHGVNISASFGVACIPETSSSMIDVIPMADAALYEAKLAGKDCVRGAKPKAPDKKESPRLVTA